MTARLRPLRRDLKQRAVSGSHTTSFGIAIVLEATLGFLGAGIPPPTPTWGNMLGDAASMLIPKWHLVVFPGVAIVIAVLCFNQFGDGLRDALDPRLRGTNL